MSNPLFDRLPPDKNPLTNKNISRVQAEADLCRAFTVGFHMGTIGYRAEDIEKVSSVMATKCVEYGRWCGAGFVYAHQGWNRNDATQDWFMYLETGKSKLKDNRKVR